MNTYYQVYQLSLWGMESKMAIGPQHNTKYDAIRWLELNSNRTFKYTIEEIWTHGSVL